MAETGMVGYLPRPAEPFVFSFRNFPSCKMLTDILHVMGIFMGGRHNRCMGSLAAGQIDKHGNINSTIIPGVTYITGSGGANDITSSSRAVVVCLQQSPRRFVDKVPYITAPGRTARTVVSDRAPERQPRVADGGGGVPDVLPPGASASAGGGTAVGRVRAAPERVWPVLVDYRGHPRYYPRVVSAELVEADAYHALVRYEVGVGPFSFGFHMMKYPDPARRRIDWHLDANHANKIGRAHV